jgi:hypothetical protein
VNEQQQQQKQRQTASDIFRHTLESSAILLTID